MNYNSLEVKFLHLFISCDKAVLSFVDPSSLDNQVDGKQLIPIEIKEVIICHKSLPFR